MSISHEIQVQSSLEALPHSTAVINRAGRILLFNEAWKTYGCLSGLSSRFMRRGASYYEMMSKMLPHPGLWTELHSALTSIFSGERMVYAASFRQASSHVVPKHHEPASNHGHPTLRRFRVEACPFIGPFLPPGDRYIAVAHREIETSVSTGSSRFPLAVLRGSGGRRYLPICASCKSVLNRGKEWVPIERYVQQELSTEFTHDICPACIRRLYPKYAGVLDNAGEQDI